MLHARSACQWVWSDLQWLTVTCPLPSPCITVLPSGLIAAWFVCNHKVYRAQTRANSMSRNQQVAGAKVGSFSKVTWHIDQ